MEIFILLAEIHVSRKFHRCRLIKFYEFKKEFWSGGLQIKDYLIFKYFSRLNHLQKGQKCSSLLNINRIFSFFDTSILGLFNSHFQRIVKNGLKLDPVELKIHSSIRPKVLKFFLDKQNIFNF